MSIDLKIKKPKMKQEKGRTFNNFSKGVKSTRSKLKQTTISTSIKNAPQTAKVNSTWNNVLNKNKVNAYCLCIHTRYPYILAVC